MQAMVVLMVELRRLTKLIIEKDITLKVCLYLEAYFKKTGLKVKLTRSKDEAF